ncbi:hypothetical protein EBZ80_26005, partial [bacterium]|nr:hypothetical protein [bacterium]
MTIDLTGNLYVADSGNNLIRKLVSGSSGYTVSTIAGTNGSGYINGPGLTAKFFYPLGITIDSSGNLYVIDLFNKVIRKLVPGANGYTVSTIA